jgi:hypothetical protein
MKNILLILTLGALLAYPSFAKADDSTNAPPGGHYGHGMGFLTDAQKQELKAAHDAAIAANPTLGTQETDLMGQMKDARDSGSPPSDDLKAKMHAFRDTMNAAMIKADPNVAPILDEIKAHHHGGAGGPPPPPPGA